MADTTMPNVQDLLDRVQILEKQLSDAREQLEASLDTPVRNSISRFSAQKDLEGKRIYEIEALKTYRIQTSLHQPHMLSSSYPILLSPSAHSHFLAA
jgi:uncharacterized protein YicC (UPF0701 family)